MAHDLLIVGGGINGCAIAREAALHGLSVLLVEKDDLAAHTSSASTKLIHGGLRYLEYYEFRLVREALHERERLLKAAPHLIHPLAFVLPHGHAVRPRWMVRTGLFVYDLLAGKSSLPRSRALRRRDRAYRAPLRPPSGGFVYWDALVDDARLTLANALDAAAAGAEIATRTALVAATRSATGWRATLSDGRTVEARALVNAAGPWVCDLLGTLGVATGARVRLVKGSHILVPRRYAGDHAYILPQPDRRIVFAIPWERDFTMIGTTDVPVDRPEDAVCTDAEVAYLCEAVSRHFLADVVPEDVVHRWSGVRALHDDGAAEARAVTRDYHLALDPAAAPILSVFGGKITTARALAEEAMEVLAPLLGVAARAVTLTRPFPGASPHGFEAMVQAALLYWPFLGEPRARRMTAAYGEALGAMLADTPSLAAMGRDFGHGFSEVEARWMRTQEWARTPEDALWRRSKLGLHLSRQQQADFAAWWAASFP